MEKYNGTNLTNEIIFISTKLSIDLYYDPRSIRVLIWSGLEMIGE